MNSILKFIQQLFVSSSRTNKQLPQYDKRQSLGQKTVIRNKTVDQNNWGGWSAPLPIGKIGKRTPRDIANDCWNIILPEQKTPPSFAAGGIVPKDSPRNAIIDEYPTIIPRHNLDSFINEPVFKNIPLVCKHKFVDVTCLRDRYKNYMCVKCGKESSNDTVIIKGESLLQFLKDKHNDI